jgi:cytochrome c oxidase subunit 2
VLHARALNRTVTLPTFALVSTRHEYGHVFGIYLPIAIGVVVFFALAIVLSAVLAWRRPPGSAARWHENNPLELTYAGVLVVVVAFLLYVTFTAEHKVDTVSARQHPSLTVDVIGAKWEWQFAYPAYGFSVRSGTVGRQPLVVPTNEAISFKLNSIDVIHAFWIPELQFKRALIPGRTLSATLVFTRAGSFQGQCAEFCGLRHSDMVFPVRAVSPAQFAAWARSRGRAPLP